MSLPPLIPPLLTHFCYTMAGILSGSQNVHIGGGTITAAQTIINNHNFILLPQPLALEELERVPVPLRPNSDVCFTGRREILEKLKVYFGSQIDPQSRHRRQYLIYGMGGIGKTQICLRFIEEMSSHFSQVFWIDASSHTTIIQGLKGICNDSLANSSPELALQWLGSLKENYLLTFDNADSLAPDELQKYFLPGLTGNILITSQNAHM